MSIRTPLSPDPVPFPRGRAIRAILVVVAPVFLLAVGLWVLAEQLEDKAAAQASVGPVDNRWRTPAASTVLERIAFGSCLDQRRPQPVWRAVLAKAPQLFLMMGDNVYGDTRSSDLAELKAAYRAQAEQPELAVLRARVPVLATWDDHDYGLNDASAAFPWKEGSRRLFAEFWNVAARELPAGGIYRSRIVGPPGRRVQIILLDLRSFRSQFDEVPLTERQSPSARYRPAPAGDSRTMLGEAQWAWLEAELRQPAAIRLVVSSTQLLAEGHRFERWGHLPHERERFLTLLSSTGARGVVVLSGDRHRGAIYREAGRLAYPLHEVTSSALNRSVAGADPDDSGRLTPMLGQDNFGLVAIDWATRRLTLSLNRASDGEAAHTLELRFADLGLP
jgi:alkaline phosphatase D